MGRNYKHGLKKPLKKKKIRIEDTILETLPPKTGSKTDGVASETPKNFTQLIKEVDAIKKHLETHLNTKDSKILLNSVENALQVVDCYRWETRIGMPPFDWERRKFVWNKRSLQIFYPDFFRVCKFSNTSILGELAELLPPNPEVEDKICKSTKIGLTDSPHNSVTGSNTVKGHSLHFQNKEYWCVCCNQDVGMEEPMNESNCFTLRRLKQRVARATPTPTPTPTPRPSVDQPLFKILVFIPSLLDPNVIDIPLNEKEKEIWLCFKEFDKGTPEVTDIDLTPLEEAKRSIKLDHPIVGVIGDFAVAVFNKACEMHVKKGEHNNLHDVEFMECKYMKFSNAYYFYMTMEAIEEGNLGVYETQVVYSSDDGRRALNKFVLTDRIPVGTKAMAISYFSCVRSICKALEGVSSHKRRKACKIIDATTGCRGNGAAFGELSRIFKAHTKAMEGLRQVLYLDPPLLFPPDCNRTSNQDVWSHLDEDYRNGMVRRTKVTHCRGYDYFNPNGPGSCCCIGAERIMPI